GLRDAAAGRARGDRPLSGWEASARGLGIRLIFKNHLKIMLKTGRFSNERKEPPPEDPHQTSGKQVSGDFLIPEMHRPTPA
ncbi:MAG TPA: hypothetical protein VFK82_00440, partial [Burkholderiaceae bacterium]|nr:hypothetical protein [Burkholderiaceae bacterium]